MLIEPDKNLKKNQSGKKTKNKMKRKIKKQKTHGYDTNNKRRLRIMFDVFNFYLDSNYIKCIFKYVDGSLLFESGLLCLSNQCVSNTNTMCKFI